MTQTIAESIAVQFDNDGTVFLTDDGRRLETLCEERSVRGIEQYHKTGSQIYRYLFADGSAIVVAGPGWSWDIEGTVPFSMRDSE